MSAYREHSDPHVDEELHAMGVSVAKGGTVVGILGGLACCTACVVVVLFFAADDASFDPKPVEAICGLVTLALGIGAWLNHAKRRRTLRIVRHGESVRLEVAADGVTLEFPLGLHGLQFRSPVGRMAVTEVYLQLVDAKKRAVTLHETRGSIFGKYETWFPGDLDKSARSTLYDVSGADTLGRVKGWVEALDLAIEKAKQG